MTDHETMMQTHMFGSTDPSGFARPQIDQYTAPRVKNMGNASAPGLILAFLDRMSPEQAQATIDLAQTQLNRRKRDAMASRAVTATRGMGA